MKVLYLTESLTIPGGRARFSRDLIKVMAQEHGVEPVILCAVNDPEPGYPYKPEPIQLAWTEWWGKRMHLGMFLNAPKLWAHLKDAALVHVLAEPLASTAWLATRFRRKPYLISGLGTYAVEPFVLGKMRWLAERVYSSAAAVPCISQYTKGRLLEVCPSAPALAVPIGHTPPICTLDPGGCPQRDFFLTVGPLKTRKGQIHILEAFARLAGRFPGVDWVVAGYSYDEEYRRWFPEQVAKAGLTDRVHFAGTISEEVLRGLYEKCLFNVLTPVPDNHAFEGFGLTYLEAGFHGRPSIGATECGASESIDQGVEGFLVPPGDVDSLTQAMETLLADPDRREKMGRAARARAERMTWSATGDRLAELYQEVVGKYGR